MSGFVLQAGKTVLHHAAKLDDANIMSIILRNASMDLIGAKAEVGSYWTLKNAIRAIHSGWLVLTMGIIPGRQDSSGYRRVEYKTTDCHEG